ncbi:MAG: hypothetical protein LKK08_01895 [Bacteroidales bacterium]|nr:hypothetical protein [Bacteroidales bacterium]MCI2144993.1 hypothetical protein [Bacteroidales bacterium]
MAVLVVLSSSLLFNVRNGFACTSAVISAKASADGRPMLWKNRDTDEQRNRVEAFKGDKFDFIALVNSPDVGGGQAWAGDNEAGFCIMNTASYNLKAQDDTCTLTDMEGVLMYRALSICSNLKDFEKLLDTLPKPLGVEANFGVIDTYGGAAFYEVNDFQWIKRDANDIDTAPDGYLVYTNFSFSGREDEGMGYVRWNSTSKLFGDHLLEGNMFSPEWILSGCSRSFYNSLLGIDLVEDIPASGYFVDQDFIPRGSTSAAIVFQGVRENEDPTLTVMWTVLGYPPVSCAVPLFVNTELPSYVVEKSKDDFECRLDEWALERKAKVFDIKRGNGKKYFNFTALYNKNGSGLMQESLSMESKVFVLSEPLIDSWRKRGSISPSELSSLYEKIGFLIFD